MAATPEFLAPDEVAGSSRRRQPNVEFLIPVIPIGLAGRYDHSWNSTNRRRYHPALYPRTLNYMNRPMPDDYEWRTMTGEQHLCAIHKDENDDVFVLVGGVRIAKRGLGTAHAATWITLQPGWLVRDVKGGKAIEVR